MAKKALGRGLESLIPRKSQEAGDPPAGRSLPVSKIHPNPNQPRKQFHPGELDDLVASVREKGVLQPVLVRRRGDEWELVAGERRWRAARKLGLLSIPAVEVKATDAEALEIALVENLQRTDLSPLEEAEGYQRLQQEFQMTQERIAHRVGKDRATVANALRLLKLPPSVKRLLAEGKLTAGHARVLVGLGDAAAQARLAERIVREGWSVREAERHVQEKRRASGEMPAKADRKDPNTVQLETDLGKWLGTKVAVHSDGKGRGHLRIEYYTLEDLDRILEHFRRAGLR